MGVASVHSTLSCTVTKPGYQTWNRTIPQWLHSTIVHKLRGMWVRSSPAATLTSTVEVAQYSDRIAAAQQTGILCYEKTPAPQQNIVLFDHFVSERTASAKARASNPSARASDVRPPTFVVPYERVFRPLEIFLTETPGARPGPQFSTREHARHSVLGLVHQAVRLLGVTRKPRYLRRDCLRMILRCEFPISKMYWARTGTQNISPSLQMLCERRAYLLNDQPGLHTVLW